MSWDNRANSLNNYPDFKTGEILWIGSSYCPKWVQPRLNCSEDAFGRGMYRSNRETKLTEMAFRNCNDIQQQKDISILLAALKASSRSRDLESGKKFHADAIESGDDSNSYVANSLVDMYAKCGSMQDARRVFDRMPCHNVVSWNALMLGYGENGEGEVALQLFVRMRFEDCAPNRVTFLAALKACTSLAAKEEGKQVDGKLLKTGCLDKGMAIHSQAAKCGCDSEIYVANTLVDMYSKCGSLVDAHGVFDRMPCRDVVSWNALMLGYAEYGEGEVALDLLVRMRFEGCAPNRVTFVAALKACGSVGALDIGKTIHADIHRCGLESDGVLAASVVDFYGKCGSMVDAQQVFDSIATRDLVTWNALIAGYSRQGNAKHVFDLFERLQKERLQPDGITFLSILTSCSHAGLVDKGKEYFQAMCSKYGITPSIDHYTSMVDLLGRANQLDDALAMVKSMPFEPDVWIWMTVLGACRKWRNVTVGRLAYESLLRLDDKHGATYVLMANVYVGFGMWEDRDKIQSMRRNARAWKKPGPNPSHPQSEDIHAKLKQFLVKMKLKHSLDRGYVTDEEDSEKLPVACALINTVPKWIGKNLRVCDDCHKATAIISKIQQRPIICKDASGFHVFEDGKCSCGDFW